MASADTISLGKTKDANKLESIKNWTISTYKCSRQALFEKLGKTSRTVDTELETQIENLRDTQRKYGHILKLARALTSHFYHVIQTQVIEFFQSTGCPNTSFTGLYRKNLLNVANVTKGEKIRESLFTF